jgi:putative DNA primase/helicase
VRFERDQFVGKWGDILSIIGIDRKFLTGKHTPCPLCEGKDRFRFMNTDGHGTWVCTHCEGGDGIKLAMAYLGADFTEAIKRVQQAAGTATVTPIKTNISDEGQRTACRALWQDSQPITQGDPAWRYLERRLGQVPFSPWLRFVQRMRYQGENPSFLPGMIARVIAPDGKSSTIHRTFLTDDGWKAPGDSPKRLMPGHVAAGSAVRLSPATDVLGIAEGIETALAASILFDVPVWAVLGTANMEAFTPPDSVRELVIFADNDAKFAGQAAAYRLAFKTAVKDRQVRVEMPPPGDWNDVLNTRLRIAA